MSRVLAVCVQTWIKNRNWSCEGLIEAPLRLLVPISKMPRYTTNGEFKNGCGYPVGEKILAGTCQ